MTTPNQILVDLLAGDSTIDSLQERVSGPYLTLKSMLQKHEIDGLVNPVSIAQGTLTSWRLTVTGREVAAALQATCTATA